MYGSNIHVAVTNQALIQTPYRFGGIANLGGVGIWGLGAKPPSSSRKLSLHRLANFCISWEVLWKYSI